MGRILTRVSRLSQFERTTNRCSPPGSASRVGFLSILSLISADLRAYSAPLGLPNGGRESLGTTRVVMAVLGIRREDKGEFERRAPLSPDQVAQAIRQHQLQIQVQSSTVRVFADDEYRAAGATVVPHLQGCDMIMGVKEIPEHLIEPGQAYLFFSHTIKAQPHNMPMLKRIQQCGGTLLDYERITDDTGRRLVFFGYHAGLAGMVDSLWTVGQRLKAMRWETPFRHMELAFHYRDLTHAVADVERVGREIGHHGLPKALSPFIIGITGYGNVSRGAQFVVNHLPTQSVAPEELAGLFSTGGDPRKVYVCVFEERHFARLRDGGAFDLKGYLADPEPYEGCFAQYLPYLRLLVNCIYWEPRFPRLVSRSDIQHLHRSHRLRLGGIGDISCDIDGSIELTTKATTQRSPLLVYDPRTDAVTEGIAGPGLAVMAIDNLPAELPRDSTEHFGHSLAQFLPALAGIQTGMPFDAANLPGPLRRATIVWNGQLVPEYGFLAEHLQ